MRFLDTFHNFRRRERQRRHLRMAEAAAAEWRLIALSGELALRHAADLTHSPMGTARPSVNLYAGRGPADTWQEFATYVAAIVATAIVLAVALLFLAPEGLRG